MAWTGLDTRRRERAWYSGLLRWRTELGLVHPTLYAWLLPNFYPSRLSLQEYTESRSPTGAVIKGWAPVAGMTDIPCRIAPQSGLESRTAEQVLTQDVQTCVVPLDLVGVSTGDRAIVDGETFDIVSVDKDGQQTPPGLWTAPAARRG